MPDDEAEQTPSLIAQWLQSVPPDGAPIQRLGAHMVGLYVAAHQMGDAQAIQAAEGLARIVGHRVAQHVRPG